MLLFEQTMHAANSCTARTLIGTAEAYGFSGNLWHSFLALQLVLDENPFTLAEEGRMLQHDASAQGQQSEPFSLALLAKEELEEIRDLFAAQPSFWSRRASVSTAQTTVVQGAHTQTQGTDETETNVLRIVTQKTDAQKTDAQKADAQKTDAQKADAQTKGHGFCSAVLENALSCYRPAHPLTPMGACIQKLGEDLAAAVSGDAFYRTLTVFYHTYGAGVFACHPVFQLADTDLLPSLADTVGVSAFTAASAFLPAFLPAAPSESASASLSLLLHPVQKPDCVTLDDLIGYAHQKELLVKNTEAFCSGLPANNVLLYGDSGTGKSTSIRAVVNAYWRKGLRLIEVRRHQFRLLPLLIDLIRGRNYRFILYLDDLSFEEFETEYKYLKAVIEGGAQPRPDNVLIYATSNRRHLIRESESDRSDMQHGADVHHSDTMEEKLSLASRFGLALCYARPDRQRFYDMAVTLARRAGIRDTQLSDEQLRYEANKFSMRGGGLSGRTAQQFVDFLLSGEGKAAVNTL